MKRSVVFGLASGVVVALWATPVFAQQKTLFENIELCNSLEDSKAQARIAACTAIIDARTGTAASVAVAHNNRGITYALAGQFDKALEDFEAAVALDPTSAKAFNNRGLIHQKQAAYDRAIKDFSELIGFDPANADTFANSRDDVREDRRQ